MAQGGPLDGFAIDQILDCSSPAAASVSDCKMDNLPAGAKVIKIYFAKQGSNVINIKFLPVPVLATK
jgi:hypothetical protein